MLGLTNGSGGSLADLMTTPEPQPGSAVPPPAPTRTAAVGRPSGEDAPAVVAVVTTKGGAQLAACLAGLAAQDYPAQTILVLDHGDAAGRDARRDEVAAVAPGALVRVLDIAADDLRHDASRDTVIARNDVMDTVKGAPFLCFVADDVVLEARSIGLLVEEAFRSNAAICGPKIVDRLRPEVLVEVGMAVDHYGVATSGIEPGEVDQEQHDAVRDVFFVSSAAMLVRADMFVELGGFDPRSAPGNDDLDLCWRARLAGARVLVVPDARAARPLTTARRADARRADVKAATRTRARTLIKCYSAAALVWVLPVATLLNLGEAIGYVVTRRPGLARAVLAGWWGALCRPGAIRGPRRATQAQRRVDDRDVRAFMLRGSARLRGILVRRRHRIALIDSAGGVARNRIRRARTWLAQPDAMLLVVLIALVAFGARHFVLDSVPSIGGFRRWASPSDLLGAFGGQWRFAGLGADSGGPTNLVGYGVLSVVTFGDADLARALVVVAAAPVGLIGVYRLVRPFGMRPLPALGAVAVYGANPVLRNAYAAGRLSALVGYAVLPFVLVRAAKALSRSAVDDAAAIARRRRAAASSVALLAIAAACEPAYALFPLLVTAAMLATLPVVGGVRLAGRVAAASALATIATLVLLTPWSPSWLGASAGALGARIPPELAAGDLLAFRTGPAGAGPWPWFMFAAAALPLVVAGEERFAWAVRAWAMTAISFAVVLIPMHLGEGVALPSLEVLLVPAALGLAVAAGLGLAAFSTELRRFGFSARQGAAIALAVAAAFPVVGLAPDLFDGRYRAPNRDFGSLLSFTERSGRGFRILWVGASEALPLDPTGEVDGVAYAFTRNGTGDIRDQFPPSIAAGDRIVEESIALARSGRIARFGHVVAPMAVRYIAFVDRVAPDAELVEAFDPQLQSALTTQLDLRLVRRSRGLVLYENEAWLPMRSAFAGSLSDVARGELETGEAIAVAARSELHDDVTELSGPWHATVVPEPSTVLLAEHYSGGWSPSATTSGVAFGWSSAIDVGAAGTVSLRHDAGSLHEVRIGAVAALWGALIVAATMRRRVLPRGKRGAPLDQSLPGIGLADAIDLGAVPASDAASGETPGATEVPGLVPAAPAAPDGPAAPGAPVAPADRDDDLEALMRSGPDPDADFDWSVLSADNGNGSTLSEPDDDGSAR